MASIMEELIITLEKELDIYESFVPICRKKTAHIIANEAEKIKEISDEEQKMLDELIGYENKRKNILKDVATVMNSNYQTLKIADVIKMLDRQPAQQKKLSKLHDSLKSIVKEVVEINNHNTLLIEQSLDMIEFNMNFIKSTWMSPGNNGYDNSAQRIEKNNASQGGGMFDAKQ